MQQYDVGRIGDIEHGDAAADIADECDGLGRVRGDSDTDGGARRVDTAEKPGIGRIGDVEDLQATCTVGDVQPVFVMFLGIGAAAGQRQVAERRD